MVSEYRKMWNAYEPLPFSLHHKKQFLLHPPSEVEREVKLLFTKTLYFCMLHQRSQLAICFLISCRLSLQRESICARSSWVQMESSAVIDTAILFT